MQKSYIKHMVCAVLAVILLVWAGGCVTAAATPEVTPISSFSYALDAENATITLTKYTGPGGAVVVAGSYTVEATEYKTLLDADTVFRDNTAISSVVIAQGVGLAKPTAAYLFSGCTKLAKAVQYRMNEKTIFRKRKHSRGQQPRRKCHQSLCGGTKELALLHVAQGSKGQRDHLFSRRHGGGERIECGGIFHRPLPNETDTALEGGTEA